MSAKWWLAKEQMVWNADALKEPFTLPIECFVCGLYPLPGIGWTKKNDTKEIGLCLGCFPSWTSPEGWTLDTTLLETLTKNKQLQMKEEKKEKKQHIVAFATQILKAYQKKEVAGREWLPKVLKSILDMVALLHGVVDAQSIFLEFLNQTECKHRHQSCPWIMPLQKDRQLNVGDDVRHYTPSLLTQLVINEHEELESLWTFEGVCCCFFFLFPLPC